MSQAAASKIVILKTNSIQQPEASAFSGNFFFKPIVIALVPRFVSYSVKLSLNAKNLTCTTTLKIKNLKIAELDDKKLIVSVISMHLEENKENLLLTQELVRVF